MSVCIIKKSGKGGWEIFFFYSTVLLLLSLLFFYVVNVVVAAAACVRAHVRACTTVTFCHDILWMMFLCILMMLLGKLRE